MEGFFGVFATSVLFSEFSFEEFDEFGFEEHLMQSDKNFDNHEHDLAQGIHEPNTVFYFEFFSEHFGPMQSNQVSQLFVDDLELVSDKLLKHEYVLVLVDVVKTVYI